MWAERERRRHSGTLRPRMDCGSPIEKTLLLRTEAGAANHTAEAEGWIDEIPNLTWQHR